jgi:hypothetical protein
MAKNSEDTRGPPAMRRDRPVPVTGCSRRDGASRAHVGPTPSESNHRVRPGGAESGRRGRASAETAARGS